MTVQDIVTRLGNVAVNNSPAILTGLAVSGVVSTAVLAVKATPHALDSIDLERTYLDELQQASGSAHTEMSKMDIVRVTWKHYVPAVSVGLATIACVFGANTISTRRAAALATAYSLTENAFQDYREKVVEQIGETKEQKVRDEVARDTLAKNPLTGKDVLITGGGEVLCYETITGRYFLSDMETIRKAQNDINSQIINEMYASQNDFFRIIGLPPTGYGEEVGWTMDKQLKLEFSAMLSDDGKPCMMIGYQFTPVRDYHKFG